MPRGTSSSPFQDLGASLPLPRPGATTIDFRQFFYTRSPVLAGFSFAFELSGTVFNLLFREMLDILLLLVARFIVSYGVSLLLQIFLALNTEG